MLSTADKANKTAKHIIIKESYKVSYLKWVFAINIYLAHIFGKNKQFNKFWCITLYTVCAIDHFRRRKRELSVFLGFRTAQIFEQNATNKTFITKSKCFLKIELCMLDLNNTFVLN